MEKFKVGDLYLIKPMQLVKSKSFTQLAFTYNIWAKMGLIPKDKYDYLFLDSNPSFTECPFIWLSNTIQQHVHNIVLPDRVINPVPAGLYESALNRRKETFFCKAADTTIALKKGWGYKDIFSDTVYDLYFPKSSYRDFHDEEEACEKLVAISDYCKDLTSAVFEERGLTDDIVKKYELIEQLEETANTELSLSELHELRERIIDKNHDEKVTYEHGHTSMWSRKFCDTAFSFDQDGNECSPTVVNKISQRRLILPIKG